MQSIRMLVICLATACAIASPSFGQDLAQGPELCPNGTGGGGSVHDGERPTPSRPK